MKKPLYQHIASTLIALDNCKKSGNTLWEGCHREALGHYEELLPSGAGIDTGSIIDIERSTPDKLVIVFSFHHLNSNGFYTRWTDHTAVIKPSLAFGIDIRITGRDHNDIKDYLHEAFDCALRQEVERYSGA